MHLSKSVVQQVSLIGILAVPTRGHLEHVGQARRIGVPTRAGARQGRVGATNLRRVRLLAREIAIVLFLLVEGVLAFRAGGDGVDGADVAHGAAELLVDGAGLAAVEGGAEARAAMLDLAGVVGALGEEEGAGAAVRREGQLQPQLVRGAGQVVRGFDTHGLSLAVAGLAGAGRDGRHDHGVPEALVGAERGDEVLDGRLRELGAFGGAGGRGDAVVRGWCCSRGRGCVHSLHELVEGCLHVAVRGRFGDVADVDGNGADRSRFLAGADVVDFGLGDLPVGRLGEVAGEIPEVVHNAQPGIRVCVCASASGTTAAFDSALCKLVNQSWPICLGSNLLAAHVFIFHYEN